MRYQAFLDRTLKFFVVGTKIHPVAWGLLEGIEQLCGALLWVWPATTGGSSRSSDALCSFGSSVNASLTLTLCNANVSSDRLP